MIHSSSRAQRTIALSSAEAELYSGVSAACDAILIKQCICFLLHCELDDLKLKLFMDNTAARQIMRRQGVGKVRHLSTRCLWIQTKVKAGEVLLSTIPTRWNVADLGTKRLHRDRMRMLMYLCGVYDMSCDERVGHDVFDEVQTRETFSKQIRNIRELGFSHTVSKQILRVVLAMSALSPSYSSDPADASCALNGYRVLERETQNEQFWPSFIFCVLFLCIYVCYALRDLGHSNLWPGRKFSSFRAVLFRFVLDAPTTKTWVNKVTEITKCKFWKCFSDLFGA